MCIFVLVPFVRGVKKKPSYLSANTKNTGQHEYIPWDPTREVSSISFASRKIPQFPSHTKSRFEGAGFVLQANIVWLQFLHLQTSCIKTNMPQHVERQGRNKQIYSQMFVKGSSPMPQFMHLHDECLISGCKCCHPITSSVFSAFLFNIEHLPTFSSDRSHVLTNLNISSPMLLTWESAYISHRCQFNMNRVRRSKRQCTSSWKLKLDTRNGCLKEVLQPPCISLFKVSHP